MWKRINNWNKYYKENLKKVTELREGTLLIEVMNGKQSEAVKKLRILDGSCGEVLDHGTLNQVKGMIYYKNKPGCTEEDILSAVKDQNVSSIYNIKRRVLGIIDKTLIYMLTFDACILSLNVTIGWTQCPIREYVPPSRRCFNYNRYGHGSTAAYTLISHCPFLPVQ